MPTFTATGTSPFRFKCPQLSILQRKVYDGLKEHGDHFWSLTLSALSGGFNRQLIILVHEKAPRQQETLYMSGKGRLRGVQLPSTAFFSGFSRHVVPSAAQHRNLKKNKIKVFLKLNSA